MRLEFDPKPSAQYPHGYWYAESDTLGVDAAGPDPASTLAALVVAAEEWQQEKRTREVT